MMQEIKEKVSSLEKVLEDFILQTNRGFAEMRASRDQADKDRERSEKSMEDFKAEMRSSRERSEKSMEDFKAEMQASRDRADKRMEEFKAVMNKKWGELANRLGTLAEDLVAPNIPTIAAEYFQCPPEPLSVFPRSLRTHRTDPSQKREFDVVAVYDEKVILNETKSTATTEYVEKFVKSLPEFFDFFPEYEGRELIPIFAALHFNEQTVDYATKRGIYILAMKGDSMDLLNYRQISEGKLSGGRGC